MIKGREGFRKEVFNAIDNMIDNFQGRPVPISKIIFIMSTRYGCGELMIRRRLNNLMENDFIKITENDEVVSLKPGNIPEEKVEKKAGGW
jgi:hypothetical protein